MKIIYFSPYCLLRPSTNRIFDFRIADGFAGHGVNTELISPYYYLKENIKADKIPKYYGMQHQFRYSLLPTPLNQNLPGWLQAVVLIIAFSLSTLRIIISNIGRLGSVYILARDSKLLVPVILLKKIFGLRIKVIQLVAEVRKGKLYDWVYRNSNGICGNVSYANEVLMQKLGWRKEKFEVMLAPIPVYKNDCSKEEAREKINYNSSNPLVVYTGKVVAKNFEVLSILDAAALLKEYEFLFTGGKVMEVEKLRALCKEKNIDNVTFAGFFDDTTFIRYYQLAADVLISYYNKRNHDVDYNFPQKITEYMSTYNPVVTPNWRATRDVLNETNAIFVEPENPSSLAAGIKKAIEDKTASQKVAHQAFRDVQELTFEKRTAVLIKFFESLE